KGRREKVVLASKFGIRANWKASAFRPFKPLLRFMKGRKDVSISSISNASSGKLSISDHFHDRIPLNAGMMKKSLESTLSALKTDYLDYFFIHEPPITISNIDELLEAAERLKNVGKIKAFGIASMKSQLQLHSSYLNKFDVQQFDHSPGSLGYENVLTERSLMPNIFFSPFRGGTMELTPTEKLKRLVEDF